MMTPNIYYRPVIPLLIMLITGIALGAWLPGNKLWAGWVIFLGAALILWAIFKQKTAFCSPLVLFAAIGCLSIQPWLTPRFPPHHVIHFLDTNSWEIIGRIDYKPAVSGDRLRFILRTDTLRGNSKSFPVIGKIRVTVTGSPPNLSTGDRIAFYSRIRSIRNFNNPGRFDYQRYMAFKKIWGIAYISGKRLAILDKNKKRGLGRIVADTRCKISELIDKTAAQKPQSVLKALIVGDRSSIPPDLREAFNRAGVGHLLAISGLHIGIVATGAFMFFVRILSYIKPLLWHARIKKAAVVFSLIPVFFYGLLAGMSPSTQRAVIMVTVFLLSFIFEREQDLMNTLALAAMLILVVDPPALFSISFQLSFMAVLVIIYGLSRVQNPWQSELSEIKKTKLFQIKQKLFYFLAASFLAILGTLPLGMLYFNQISLVGLLANVIIVPLIGSVVVPLGLLAVFLHPLTISGAAWFLGIGAKVLALSLTIVEFFSGLPCAAVKTVTPTCFEICLYYLLLWSLVNIKGIQPTPSGRKETHNTQSRARNATWNGARATAIYRQKLAGIIAVVVILAGIGDMLYWCNRRFWHDDLRVTIIDVRHGSSVLLELPRGYNILIDGGGFTDNTVFDIGARIVAPLLWRKKIKTVDTIVLSHPNSDHLNGLIYIAEHFNVKEAWTNNQASDTSSYHKFITVIAKNRIHRPMFKELPCSRKINGVRLDILYPPFDFIDRSKREGWRDLNNNSMVIKATLGSISFLFPGDIKARAESELAANFANLLKSTVLLAPHHGSKTSSTDMFLVKVAPEVVIISSGRQSRFGCPHPAVLKRYQKYGFRIFETACHGAVCASTDGRSLTIKTAIVP